MSKSLFVLADILGAKWGSLLLFSVDPQGHPTRVPFSSQTSSILNCIYCIYNLSIPFQLFVKQLFCA